jgi:hypothetical protein
MGDAAPLVAGACSHYDADRTTQEAVVMKLWGRHVEQLAFMVLIMAVSPAVLADGKLSGRVTDLDDMPVKDAHVVLTGPTGVVTQATTDATGSYAVTVDAAGAYALVIDAGGAQRHLKIDIPADVEATLDSKLEIGGEVIEVQGNREPLRYARVVSDPLAIPPYSDAAVLGDVWVRAWLMLDVDEHGVVNRARFLKRPGHDLDDIAVKHVFGVRFDPARDPEGRPARSYVVVPLEWPAKSWLQMHSAGSRRRDSLPAAIQRDSRGMVFDIYPPCAGTRSSIRGESSMTVMRDCSTPNLAKIDASEPWYARDPSLPVPPMLDAPKLDPAKVREEPVALARRNHRLAIATTAAAGALAVGTVLSYLQYAKWSARVDDDQSGRLHVDRMKLNHDQARKTGWGLGMVGFGVGALANIAAGTHFWLHSSAVTVQPRGDGGSLAYSGRF